MRRPGDGRWGGGGRGGRANDLCSVVPGPRALLSAPKRVARGKRKTSTPPPPPSTTFVLTRATPPRRVVIPGGGVPDARIRPGARFHPTTLPQPQALYATHYATTRRNPLVARGSITGRLPLYARRLKSNRFVRPPAHLTFSRIDVRRTPFAFSSTRVLYIIIVIVIVIIIIITTFSYDEKPGEIFSRTRTMPTHPPIAAVYDASSSSRNKVIHRWFSLLLPFTYRVYSDRFFLFLAHTHTHTR